MLTLGKLIKDRRLTLKWSLRQLAGELGVTAAYVTDLEADRRLPSEELRERISSRLQIPSEDLAAADSRLSPDLRSWIEKRPRLTALLRSLQSSPDSDLLIRRITRFVQRRLRPQTPHIPHSFVVTWESELRAIAAEASAWSVETGGDLFGRWHEVPIIFLATKAGPGAERDHAHFRLDVEYLRHLSEVLAANWGMRYFGDWHSHHRLGLSAPSRGDRQRIVRIGARNQFSAMSEIIVTLEDARNEPRIRIHPWLYDFSTDETQPFRSQIKVLPGVSPVREALLATGALQEQELFAWNRIALQRVRLSADDTPPRLEPKQDVDTTTRETMLSHLTEALQEASGSPVEFHSTGFGCVLVAKLHEPHYLALALGTAWPMAILEVHRLNRETGTTDVIAVPSGLVALDIPRVLDVFKSAVTRVKAVTDVDN